MDQAFFDFTYRSIGLPDPFQVLLPLRFAFDVKQDWTPRTNTMGETGGDLALLSLGSALAALTPAIILGDLLYH
jgi:hypothetical protein